MTQLCLLGLSGSLRRASNSTAVLRGLQEALAPKAALDIFSLHGLPLYNEDDDGEHAPDQKEKVSVSANVSPQRQEGALDYGIHLCLGMDSRNSCITGQAGRLQWQPTNRQAAYQASESI